MQTTLIFLLGFLSAAFVAVAAAPTIWRRACELTRQRIEASMPLTLNEVQADKDQQRAEFAIGLRKLEIKVKSLQEKLIEQTADSAIHREKTRLLIEECKAQGAVISERSREVERLNVELIERENDIVFLGAVQSDLHVQIAGLNSNIQSRDKTICELQIDVDNKRIELVAKLTEQDQSNVRLRELNLARKARDEKLRLVSQEMRAARETLRNDAKRLVDLERKTERLISQLSDRDERLERRDNELVRIKNSLKVSLEEQSIVKRQMQAAKQLNEQLEREIAKAGEPKGRPTNVSNNDAASVMKKLEDDKIRLTAMVRQLNEEKNTLILKLKKATNAGPLQSDEDSILRNQVHDLTAKVVSITAEVEGQKSPIAKLLQTAGSTTSVSKLTGQIAQDTYSEAPESLANRILALQKSARGG